MTAIIPANIHSMGKTNKKLVLIVADLLDRTNMSSPVGRFFKIAKEAAQLCREDDDLRSKFLFGWLDGNTIPNNIVMGEMPIPCKFKEPFPTINNFFKIVFSSYPYFQRLKLRILFAFRCS